jgi:hypothetical protein
MASQEDEKAIDGLLRRTLARGSAAADCPDAELLAAYFDKSLGVDETAQYELHFSTCSRCREQLAMMARAATNEHANDAAHKVEELSLEPVLASARPVDGIAKAAATWEKMPAGQKTPAASVITTKPQSTPSKRIDLRWLVPVAAVLLVGTFTFFRFASRGTKTPANSEIALSNSAAPPQNEVALAPEPASSARESVAPEEKAKKANPPASNRPSHPPSRPTASHPAPSGNTAATASGATRSGSAGNATSRSMRAAPGRPPTFRGSYVTRSPGRIIQERPSASAEAAQAEEGAEAAPPAPAPELNAPQSNVPVTTASADVVKSPAPPPPDAAEQKSQTSERTTTTGFAGSVAMKPFGAAAAGKVVHSTAPVVIKTSDPNVIYRIPGGGFIEISEDGGVNWLGQRLDPAADLVAGSAPDTDVCWLVGRSGAIFLTQDGKSWRKISSPVSKDLVAVEAKSAASAAITAKDGQKWSTDDGGKTWHTEE